MMWLKQGLRVPFCHTGNGQSSSVPHSSDMMLEGLELSNCPSIALDVWISQDMTSEPQNRHTLLNRNTKYSIRLFLLHSICTTTEDANQISLYNYGRKIKVFLFQDNRDCPSGFSPRSSSISFSSVPDPWNTHRHLYEDVLLVFIRNSASLCNYPIQYLSHPPSEWESQWFWPWHDCWCQMGLFEYFRDCWSLGNFTHRSL